MNEYFIINSGNAAKYIKKPAIRVYYPSKVALWINPICSPVTQGVDNFNHYGPGFFIVDNILIHNTSTMKFIKST